MKNIENFFGELLFSELKTTPSHFYNATLKTWKSSSFGRSNRAIVSRVWILFKNGLTV